MTRLVAVRLITWGLAALGTVAPVALQGQTDPHWIGSRMNEWYAESAGEVS